MAGKRGRHRTGRHERGHGGRPFGLTPWPAGSLGETSVLLAIHAGGTPWDWRDKATEQDWATALRLLAEQAERINDTTR
ncbi:hypothetical protein E5991_06970 [Bifidobacterium pseudolongum]|uniref:Uncharacterized protein n=1 Tax=Bifidobacterium pseudolongum TaxID=1694 RepID=A0A4S4F864_9BIFI|nr:hypothetical protein E5991_06970 [Bifidobacterium pseudolongum]